ncbi:MAG: 3'(2'),5'-bisphosphate nucleotidase CysQ [Pseudomonadota bacterium]
MDDITASELVDLVEQAGQAILEIYDTDFAVEQKDDKSPLTAADLASHRVLVDGLRALTPDIPILSEESEAVAFDERKAWQSYWLIDPLDGTREFVSRNGEFTVNVALIRDHQAQLGLVGVPVQGRIYFGDVSRGVALCYERVENGDFAGEALKPKSFSEQDGVRLVASRSHGGEALEQFVDALSERFPNVQRRGVGSSLKLCCLAAGDADLYPRLGPTSEWDIAAAHAVLAAAGGSVMTGDGEPLCYNTKASLLNPDFVAVADGRFDWMNVLPAVPVDAR